MTRPQTDRDLYEALGVAPDASASMIKAAYRTLAREVHPDTAPGEDALERFKDLAEAYAVLSDPERRAEYDTMREPSTLRGADGELGLLPESFPTGKKRRGADSRVELSVSFFDALLGAISAVKIPGIEVCPRCHASGAEPGTSPTTCSACRGSGQLNENGRQSTCRTCRGHGELIEQPCHTCSGEGVVRGPRRVPISVPPGAATGDVIRLPGQGDAGERGGAPGDVLVTLRVGDHPVFARNGEHISVSVPVAISEAALGGAITVPSPTGPLTLKLPEGTPNNATLRVRGRGFARADGSGAGDLLVTVQVQVPQSLSRKARKALEELAKELGNPDELLRGEVLALSAASAAEAKAAAPQQT